MARIDDELRVRVLVGTEVRWMTLLASRVMNNWFARRRANWNGGPGKQSHCKHGHQLNELNVKEYQYNGYMHRTCMPCVYARNEARKNDNGSGARGRDANAKRNSASLRLTDEAVGRSNLENVG